MTVINAFMICLLLACSNSAEVNNGQVVQLDKKQDAAAPTSVDSRFFDLGGIINELFPELNQGNLGGPGRNQPGMDFPANSQFYPAVAIQGQTPPISTGQGSNWPVIDDAKQFPNKGRLNTQIPNPNQGTFGGLPQTQYPSQGNFNAPQGTFGGLYPNQRPNFPASGGQQNFNSQFPNQGFDRQPQFPNQGSFGTNQFPNQGNWQRPPQTNIGPQNPNQPTLNSQYPNQGNFGGSQTNQFPNQMNPWQNQYPNQGVFTGGNQNSFGRRPTGGDGTLDSVIPPQVFAPSNPGLPNSATPDPVANQPIDPEERPISAILGNPVRVPSSTEQTGRINYPTSTESPAKKQCVQDCQTTSEYNPVCGSDNVTYINPGKFVCARNCGINVFVMRRGRCPDDTPNPPSSLCSPTVERKMCTV